MKVKDLIKELKYLDPETVIVLSSDAEGNSYSECQVFEEYLWNGEEGEIHNFDEVEDDHEYSRAVVLWP